VKRHKGRLDVRRAPTLDRLPTWSGHTLNVVIETPKNQPNKLKFDADVQAMRLSKVLPAGMVFPFDFGFLPSTLGEDGDPLDVLVLMDAPAPAGCLITARLIGVLRCMQRERPGGRPIENDRFLAVAEEASTYRDLRDIRDLSGPLLDQIEAFFVQYNQLAGHEFEVVRRQGAKAARRSVDGAQVVSRLPDA
jgi:inorganic pyrophosphatase